MSEYERPTAVSDDERSATPVNEGSAKVPAVKSVNADADGHEDGEAGDRDAEAAEQDLPGDDDGSTDDAGSSEHDGSTDDAGSSEHANSADDAGSPVEEPNSAEVDALERPATEGTTPGPIDVVLSNDEAGTAEEDGDRPTSSRRRRLAVIGGAAAALVLAAAFAPVAWDRLNHKDVRIDTPPRLAGLVLDDSQGAHETIDYLRTAVQTGVSLEKTTGAVYADEAGQSRSVLFIGGTGRISSPDEALTKTFQLISDESGGVESVQVVPAGPLGGVMRCGSTKTDGGSMAVCGWADGGSLGVAMFPNRPTEESAELLRTMRKAMQND
ncbi:hypothetical protein [Planosporangium mesophilum]|uniref:Uncharacterized protein n=1 Tax=Planosporangium mesophilum TaxID=689768 RepID=A0A8J3TK08_9ACTN|nr:hypothetical protein [Planosporangium mesophilum]NJC84192.1 hypothetical protein [Planosporangium mesophilum]GII22800.1 hypothetical protein Pme01_23970 [Planosporangium mesophilum]